MSIKNSSDLFSTHLMQLLVYPGGANLVIAFNCIRPSVNFTSTPVSTPYLLFTTGFSDAAGYMVYSSSFVSFEVK